MKTWLRRDLTNTYIPGVILLLTVLLIVLQIRPALHEHQQMRLLRRQLGLAAEERNGYEIYQKWKEEKENKANYLKCLQENIRHEDELDRLVESWQQSSRLFGVELIRYTPGLQGSDGEYLYKRVQFVLQGEYLAILRFLRQMMQMTSYRSVKISMNSTVKGLESRLDFEVFMKARNRNGQRTQTTETE